MKGAAPSRGHYDRAAIMRDAHKRHKDGKRLRLGWTFGRCLATAWAAAKIRRTEAQRVNQITGQNNKRIPGRWSLGGQHLVNP